MSVDQRPPPRVPRHAVGRREFFRWFEEVCPAATSRAFARGRVEGRGSSYELALDAWAVAGAPRAVLDVGCGEGQLLALAAERWPSTELLGVDVVDMSRAFDAAGHGARFWLSDAASLPLEDEQVDLTVFHFSLPFVEDPVAALREAARVLRPNGVLSVVVGAPTREETVYQRFSARVRDLYRRGHGDPIQLVDRRTQTAKDLIQLAREAGFLDISVQEAEMILDGDEASLFGLMTTTYDWAFLDDIARAELEDHCRSLLGEAPLIRCRIGLRHLVGVRRA